MTPTPTPPGGGEEHRKAVALEVGRIIQLSNQGGDAVGRLLVADDIVKLRAENERLKAALVAAESKHAEEMREFAGFLCRQIAWAECMGKDWLSPEEMLAAFLASQKEKNS